MVLAAGWYYYFRSRTGVIFFFFKIIIVRVYVPLNARHFVLSAHSWLDGASGPGAYTPQWRAWNRAGEGKDRERGPQTVNRCTLVQCVVTERGRLLPFSW